MAVGIGQQLKGMVRRARNYWSELTDENSGQKRSKEQEDEVHQRYGGVRTQSGGGNAPLRDDLPRSSSDYGSSDTQWANTSGRAGQGESQANRQYTQQGGSGNQKTLEEQIGDQAGSRGAGSDAGAAGGRQGRRPGQQNH